MKLSVRTIVIFILLGVGSFYWFVLAEPSDGMPNHFTKAWIVFMTGAAIACFADKQYGMLPPVFLRWLFILVGSLLMISILLWSYSIRSAAHTPLT
jgi:hypothetical protein